ncbi:MAG TPA: hypothetical protein VFV38_49125 [Ktedonobacteraceae bacterium]|nr:hypothetical protein [Ktedonobacteraceae bacterium]
MVRVLSSALTTSLNSLVRVPAVTLRIEDHILHYALYQSPASADGWNDACLAGDNSLVRVQVTRGGFGFTSTFQAQRVTDPTQATQWSSWTPLPGSTGMIFQDGSCALANSAGVLRAFAQRGTGGNDLWVWTSLDNGLTWTGPVTVLTPPGGALLRGIGSAGNSDVFFLYDVPGGEAMGCSFFLGGSWSALTTWSLPTIANGAGVAVAFAHSLYTLIYSDGYTLAMCSFNPASGVWSAGPAIISADSSAIGRNAPRLSLADGLYTLVCVEYDSGALTGSVYSYPRLRQSADLQHWSDGCILHELSSIYGVIALNWPAPPVGNAGVRAYVISPGNVYSAPLFQPGNLAQYLDVSASILSYTRQERPGQPARLEVLLDNEQGRYNALITAANASGNYQPVGLNASLILSEGYRTGAPPSTPAVVKVGTYHLTHIQVVRTPTANYLRLSALDLTRNLDLVARYQQVYTGATLGYLITEIAARAGLFSVVLPATTQIAQVVPAFVLQAGSTYCHALDELCTIYGLIYFLDQDEVVQVRELATGDPSVWTYQPEIETVSFGASDLRANHVIVSGQPPTGPQPVALTTAEVFDDTHMRLVGLERILHHVDPRLSTVAQCAQKAAFLLIQEARTQVAHSVTVALNPALQLYDVLTLIDSQAPGGSGQTSTCRLLSQHAHYDARQGIYELQLILEGL